jgi:hypothetical protein
MEKLYKIHRNSNQIDFQNIWKEGLFIFDSNVLLDLYRLPESAKNDLLGVFRNENFNNRIWIGFQVMMEFLNNRLTVIGDQKNMFSKIKILTEKLITEIDDLSTTYKTEIEKLKLTQRHSLINPDEYINTDNLKKTTDVYITFLKHLEDLESKQNDVNDTDEIKELIINIFNNKIGESFDKDNLDLIYKDGTKRYESKIPPGFMDIKKEGSYFFEDKEYVRKFGDLILWKEIIKLSNDKKLKYVVLVTGDVKEDWWEEKRGKKIGARKELLNEIYTQCPELDVFHLYNTSTFLKFAKEEIDKTIKDSSIIEALELINNNNKIIGSIEDISITKRDYLKQLYIINERIKRSHNILEDLNNQKSKLSNYRDELYDSSDPLDDIREYAHNLAIPEMELEEEINEIQDKITLDMKIQQRFLVKLKAEN